GLRKAGAVESFTICIWLGGWRALQHSAQVKNVRVVYVQWLITVRHSGRIKDLTNVHTQLGRQQFSAQVNRLAERLLLLIKLTSHTGIVISKTREHERHCGPGSVLLTDDDGLAPVTIECFDGLGDVAAD